LFHAEAESGAMPDLDDVPRTPPRVVAVMALDIERLLRNASPELTTKASDGLEPLTCRASRSIAVSKLKWPRTYPSRSEWG